MKCPTCNEAKLVVADRHGIQVDYCPECRGVWLERGELDKIIERTREEAEHEKRHRAVERSERHRSERQGHAASRNRESTRLVERIFDF